MNSSEGISHSVFLETSVQIARLSLPERAREVATALESIKQAGLAQKVTIVTSTVVYREFLSTLVSDYLFLRDSLKKDFIARKVFSLSFADLDRAIGEAMVFGTRVKRLRYVTASIHDRFWERREVETERLIRFLDSVARDLMYRDFFSIGIETGNPITYRVNTAAFGALECLAESPLQSDCSKTSGSGCRITLLGYAHIDSEPSLKNQMRCLDLESQPTRCLTSGTDQECRVDEFLNVHETKFKLRKLHKYMLERRFSSRFKGKFKNKKWMELMRRLEGTTEGGKFESKGLKCARYFTDVLILLQCPMNSRILSYDSDFDELGRAIGLSEIRINPASYSEVER